MKRAELTKLPVLDYHGEEAFNTITTNLAFAGKNVKKIVITSNTQSEGKSFVSMQLVRTLAQHGKKVCLVDSDLRRSYMTSTYGFVSDSNTWGLAHYLAGQCKMEDIMYLCNIDNACIVPIGSTVADPIGLLDTGTFSLLLDELAAVYDYVVVDAPPIGMVIDAAVIAKHCDGSIFVVEYNETTRKDLLSCKAQMEQSGTRIIGCIMNKVDFKSAGSKYYNKSYYKHYSSDYYK